MDGKTILLMRKAEGWTQEQLAAMVGTPQHYLSKIEQEKIRLTNFMTERILAVFGLNIKN